MAHPSFDAFDDDECRFPIAAEHWLGDEGCWCCPSVEIVEGGARIIVHQQPPEAA